MGKEEQSNMNLALKFFVIVITLLSITTVTAADNIDWSEKSIAVDGGKIYYYDISNDTNKEATTPVVLLHGLFADKEQWKGLVQLLLEDPTSHYRFLIPDLPGFGHHADTPPVYPTNVYNIYQDNPDSLSQVKVLKDWLKLLDVKRFQIAGNSLGGLIAAILTEQMPNQITSLSFIGSPAGVVPFSHVFLENSFSKGTNLFIPTTKNQVISELQLLMHNYHLPSDSTINSIIQSNLSHYQKRSLAYEITNRCPFRIGLSKDLPKIKVPTLIEWGDNDEIFGSPTNTEATGGAQLLYNHLIDSHPKESYSEENAGHLILLEDKAVLMSVENHFITFLNQISHSTS